MEPKLTQQLRQYLTKSFTLEQSTGIKKSQYNHWVALVA